MDGLKETVRRTRDDLQNIDIALLLPQAELATRWQQMKDTARRQGVSPFQISGLMTLASLDTVGKLGNGALSTVQAAGTLLSRHVLDHYREVHADIDQRGFHRTLAATARPCLQAAWGNFSPERATLTEEFLWARAVPPAAPWARLGAGWATAALEPVGLCYGAYPMSTSSPKLHSLALTGFRSLASERIVL